MTTNANEREEMVRRLREDADECEPSFDQMRKAADLIEQMQAQIDKKERDLNLVVGQRDYLKKALLARAPIDTTEAERLECGPEHIGDEIVGVIDDLAEVGNMLEATGIVCNALERARAALNALIPYTGYLPVPAASAAEVSRMMTAHNTALLALRTSEEARVKAEEERDLMTLAAQVAETALADMRRERDAAEKALLFLMSTAPLIATTDGWLKDNGTYEAITAARSRADGEEK